MNMDKSIKTLGLFPSVYHFMEVDTIVIVNVARSLEEAETQARTGQAVVATEDGELNEVPQATTASSAERDDDASDTSLETEETATDKADEEDGGQTAS